MRLKKSRFLKPRTASKKLFHSSSSSQTKRWGEPPNAVLFLFPEKTYKEKLVDELSSLVIRTRSAGKGKLAVFLRLKK
jgi:hypothetical protein